MKRFQKVYLEITNLCNLRCSFCPGTRRAGKRLSREEFTALLDRLRGWTDFLYFHLMGEPLSHPELDAFLQLAGEYGFRVILTTNGVLLPQKQDMLLSAPALHKVNVSLHAFEANDLPISFQSYLDGCLDLAAGGEKLVVYRLWNGGGQDSCNGEILSALHRRFPGEWVKVRRGERIAPQTYLEYGEKFDWPDLSAPDGGERAFCYGLRDQIGVLCDGTVVPCCLDHEGDIPLGNLFEQTMEQIMDSPRTQAICRGFDGGRAVEELCRRCGYARQKFG